ncbi:MAG: hypothetical protein SWH61_06560 [Thermodesulfobacteriota bacterium]|nr:hypothetical protein [Thermodesulfobacteriota bacterium]
MSVLPSLREKIGTRRVAVVSGILFVCSQVTIYLIVRDLSPEKVLILQTTFSQEKFLSIIGAWKLGGLLPLFKAHFYVDYFHPVWYSVFLASLMAIGFNVNNISEKYNRLLMIPFIAGFLDLVENTMELIILSNIARASRAKIVAGALAANIKWLLVGIGILIVAWLIVRWGLQGRKGSV